MARPAKLCFRFTWTARIPTRSTVNDPVGPVSVIMHALRLAFDDLRAQISSMRDAEQQQYEQIDHDWSPKKSWYP